jgi:UDP-galactopyranose mutase
MEGRVDRFDVLVVGAGFAGSVIAERLASQHGKRVLVVDRRNHVGGNAYDEHDDNGIMVHRYGPHLFHTNDMRVVHYLSQFTEWSPYEHRVLAEHEGELFPIPINRTTINRFFGVSLQTEEEAKRFLEDRRIVRTEIMNSEDLVLTQVGRELFEAFYRGYTRKQWNREPSELAPGVCGRIPVRYSLDDRYFTDRFQAVPLYGYTEMFLRMLSHENIEVQLNVDAQDVMRRRSFDRIVWTGPIDEYFGHVHGHLPYRSIRFDHVTCEADLVQPAAQINYSDPSVEYTRVCEWKHITGQQHEKTVLTREYPSSTGEPFYPIPSDHTRHMYKAYEAEARKLSNVTFAGRLAEYRYYNMDQVVARAVKTHGGAI